MKIQSAVLSVFRFLLPPSHRAWVVAMVLSYSLISIAFGGVGQLPHFVIPGEFSLGVGSELGFSSRAQLGLNFRYTQGYSDTLNFFGNFGLGGTEGDMRFGGGALLDVFPDIQGQPGFGVAFSGGICQLQSSKRFQLEAIPYLHKTLISQKLVMEPFLAFPMSAALFGKTQPSGVFLALGSLFEHSLKFRSQVELGVPLNASAYTYLAMGIAYYH